MATGEGYSVPFSADLEKVIGPINIALAAAEELSKQSVKTSESIKEMNKEIVSGATSANKALGEQAQNTINLKKAAEERAKAERVMVAVFSEVAKKQLEGVKLNDQAAKAVKDYTDNLAYFKEALKTATDPTQIQMLSNSMERMRDNIVSVYDRATKAITPMNDKLAQAGDLTDKLSDSIMGSFSTEELDKLANDLNNTSSEMEQLGTLIDFISTKMEELDKESDLFKTLSADIEEANKMLGRTSEVLYISTLSSDQLVDRLKFLKDALQIETNPQEITKLNKEIEGTENRLKQIKNAGKDGFDELGNKLIPDTEEKVKSLNTQLEQIVQQLAQMRMNGNVDTGEYEALLVQATEIKQAITAVNDELKVTTSTTQGLDTLIESASLLTAGFNLAQGSMALFGVESEDLEKITAKLTAGIAVLQGLQEIQVQLKNRESVANKALTTSQALYAVVVGTSTGALKLFRIALASTGIGLIILAIGALVANWDKLTSSINISGPAAEKWGQRIDKIKAVAIGVGNAVLQYLIGPIKALYTLFAEGPSAAIDAYVNGLDVVKSYSEGFNSEIQRQTDVAHKNKLEAQKVALEQEIEVRKAAGEKVVALETALHSTIIALTKAGSQEQIEALQGFKVFEAKTNKEAADERVKAAKKAEDDSKKASEKAKKDAEDAKRKREEELKRIQEFNSKLKDLEHERQLAAAGQLGDGADKDKQLEDLRFRKEIENLENELIAFKGTEEEKKKFRAASNALIEKLSEEHIAKMWAIDVVYFDKLAESQKQHDKLILQLNKQDQELELLEIEDKYKKISNEYLKAFGEEKDFTDIKNREISDINLKYALKELKDREDIESARITSIKINGKSEEEQEKIREAMKYQVMLDAAQERLNLLRIAGGKENEVAIAQTEAIITELNQKIGKSTTVKKTNVFQLLGLDVNDKEAGMIVDTYKQVFSQITDAWQESLNRQIDAKEKQIDALNDQISDVERALDKELELQENGYANNVEAKQQELDALKVQRDEEVRQKEELLKKEQKFAIAQVVLNGILQASNLALAATEVFKQEGKWGLAGIAIAVGAIALMMTTFMSVKSQINSMKSDVPSFRKGGAFLLNGPSHEQGGLGVYNEKTGKRVAEVEGGEGFFAINKESTRKYLPFLDAINDDDLGSVGAFMDNLLKDTGVITADKEQTSRVIILSNKNQERDEQHKEALLSFLESDELKDIASTNRKMLDLEKNRKIITETEDYTTVQQGNNIRKIKKKK